MKVEAAVEIGPRLRNPDLNPIPFGAGQARHTPELLRKLIGKLVRKLPAKFLGNLVGKLGQKLARMLVSRLASKLRSLHRDNLFALLTAKLGNKPAAKLAA